MELSNAELMLIRQALAAKLEAIVQRAGTNWDLEYDQITLLMRKLGHQLYGTTPA